MHRCCVVITVLFCSILLKGQEIQSVRTLDSVYFSSKSDSLEIIYGYNKEIPNSLKPYILTALSYFPDLDSIHIVFKESEIKTTLNVKPALLSLIFQNRHNRKYVIKINTNKYHGNVMVSNVPFNASIGLFGHEFCHIADYKNRGFFKMIKRAICYITKKSNYEKEIDLMTIERGLGWQLYDWSFFVLYKSDASEKYKAFKRKTYLTPEEIKNLLK